MSTNTHAEPEGLMHCALFYRCEHEYLDEVMAFIVDGLMTGQPVLVAAPAPNLVVLCDALGSLAATVTMADMADVGRNPARIMGVISTFVAEHRDRRVRIVSEAVWSGRTDDEYPACVETEALANVLFDGRAVSALCTYDASRLDAGVLADARMTHPLLRQSGSVVRSADYAPDDALARCNQPLPADPTPLTYMVRALADLRPARSFAARYARWLGMSPDGIANLQLVVTELATNSLQHAGGACRLAFWRYDGHIVCEASDRGRLDDRLAGRRRPDVVATNGRGLFLVNAMADLVRTHTTPNGTTIQAYLRLGPARRESA